MGTKAITAGLRIMHVLKDEVDDDYDDGEDVEEINRLTK